VVNACIWCHDGSNPDAANITTGSPDSFGLASGHSLTDPSPGTAKIEGCPTCHFTHGAVDVDGRMLPAKTINGVTVTSAGPQLCLACHTKSTAWFGPGVYPSTSAPKRNAAGYPVSGTWPGKDTYESSTNAHRLLPETTVTVGAGSPQPREQGDCRYCHASHRGANTYDSLLSTFTVPTEATLAADKADGSYADLCFKCHGGVKPSGFATAPVDIQTFATSASASAGHSIVTSGGLLPVGSPLPCFECHNPHGSSEGNGSLISDERGKSLGTTTAVGVRTFCFTCHTTAGDTPAGWDSASRAYTVVSPTDKVVGLARDGGVLHLPTRQGHAQADTESCYDCHGNSYAAGGENVHNPAVAGTGNDASHTVTPASMAIKLDGTTYDAGGGNVCSDCHSSTLRSAHTTVTASLDSGHLPWVTPFCIDCHNSSYAEANSVITIQTYKWDQHTCDQCHVTNGNGKHTTYTPAAHTATTGSNTCTGQGCHATLDVRELHNKANVGCTASGTDSLGVAGGCHALDKQMTGPLSCGAGTGGCHTNHTASNHGSPDHNAAQPLGAAVGTTGQTYSYGRNVGCFMTDSNTGCHFQDLRLEHGTTAYLAAQGVTGTERLVDGSRGSNADGCTVCHATGKGTAGEYAARTAVTNAIANGDRRCDSCHFETNDAAGTTGVQAPHKSTEKLADAPLGTTAEWAAAASAQGGGHNAFGVSFPKTGLKAYGGTVNGVPMTGTFGNMPGTFASGWSQASPVTCTSAGCHNTTTTPNGPQGASVPWYQNDGAAQTGQITTHWYTAKTTGTTVPTATGCQNCHATLSSTAHRTDHNVACESCHVRIPHAWKRPRLLRRSIDASGTTTETVDALPYSDPTVLGLQGYKVTAGQTAFSSSSDCNVNCHGPHRAAAPYWP
jgi:hypothetical protein